MHTKYLLQSQCSIRAANVIGINPFVQSLSCTPSIPRNTPLVSYVAGSLAQGLKSSVRC